MEIAFVTVVIIGALAAIASGIWIAIALVKAIRLHKTVSTIQDQPSDNISDEDITPD